MTISQHGRKEGKGTVEKECGGGIKVKRSKGIGRHQIFLVARLIQMCVSNTAELSFIEKWHSH